MESFLQRYRNLIALVVALAIQVVVLAAQIKRPADPAHPQGAQVRLVRLWMVSLFSPVEKVFVNSGSSVRGAWANYINLRSVRQQNRDLQAEINQMRLEEARLSDDAQQTRRLRGLLDFKQRYIGKTVAAEVIGTSGVEASRVIYIDKGARQGLAADMPVITPDGIVGKIREVYANYAQVLEITDVTSGAGVVLKSSRLRGILKGGTGSNPEIVNIMADENVQVGDQILTSGGDSIFPPGLPVGTVAHVAPDRDGEFFIVQVKPAASLSRLEEVLVVTKIDASVPKTEEALSGDEREAGKLAEQLPSISASSQSTVSDDEPARPTPPLQPVHPDRFSPAVSAAVTTSAAASQQPNNAGTIANSNAGNAKKTKKSTRTPTPQNAPGNQAQSGDSGAATSPVQNQSTEHKEPNSTPSQVSGDDKGAPPQ